MKNLFVGVSVVIILFLGKTEIALSQKQEKDCCIRWQSEIDESFGKFPRVTDVTQYNEQQILTAIECLFKLEGN